MAIGRGPLTKKVRGGYDPQDFKDQPHNDLPRSSLFQERGGLNDPNGQPVVRALLFSSLGSRGSPPLVSLVGSQESGCADGGLRSLVRRVTNFEKSAILLDRSLPLSFWGVHDEMDDLWKEVESIKDLMSKTPPDCSGSSPLFQGR